MTVSDEKHALRQRLRVLEQSLSADYRDASGRVIVEALRHMDAYQNAECVCCFVGTGAEIDTRPLLEDALSSGKRVCVPLCTGRGVMEMRRISSPDDLAPGVLGIPEPSPDTLKVCPSEIDFLVIPCLACDRAGNRLGRGGGYYDRFLSDYHGAAVLVCREALLQDSIPVEAHDIAPALVLSERGFYRDGTLSPS
ncbi:MAG: 5-formyltetrahydrofolate cyclo-ligase [Oscillospiraceae bacterium]|nr:5-formyltetrahydrofolate cyclo-ligase [Oscillospiraceae bacterium]